MRCGTEVGFQGVDDRFTKTLRLPIWGDVNFVKVENLGGLIGDNGFLAGHYGTEADEFSVVLLGGE